MDLKRSAALLCAAVCLSAGLTACASARTSEETAGESAASEETAGTTAASEETTESAAEETTTAVQEDSTDADADTETSAASEDAPEESVETDAPAAESEPAVTTNPNLIDGDTKILFSERGLQAVPINSVDGYGEELQVGDDYLGWKFESFDGILNDTATAVPEVYADFTYQEGTLSANGIVTVLPKDHPDYPNGMYLRVDNQADFPYFPQDTRERGKFIIENARDVFPMLGLEDPPVDEQYEVAVSVSVSTLHVHVAPNAYDTIRVTAASKR